MIGPTREALADLDAKVKEALASGDESRLRVLGYGEISTVVALTVPEGTFACKRLPPFDGRQRYEAYARVFESYVSALTARGVVPVESQLSVLDGEGGTVVAYCVQPILSPDALLPKYFAECSVDEARAIFRRIASAIDGAVDSRLGIDGQLSNWTVSGGELRYLDLTTPLVRDEHGKDQLDVGLFLASLPWALRGFVRRFRLAEILDKYFVPRGVMLDLLGNLHKERLGHLIAPFLDELGDRYAPRITLAETKAYYADDARTWSLLLRVRRLDRFWQRHARRRPYPFLLPGDIRR